MRRLSTIGFTAILAMLAASAPQAQAPAASAARAARVTPRALSPRMLPGTSEAVFTTIQGNALSATNSPLPERPVRLRDARLGRIVDAQYTDKAGLFAFRAVDPGNYVVELVDADQSVLASSEMLTVEAGQIVSTFVKLPFRVPPAGALVGRATPAALAVLATAAASGVVTRVGTTDVSGETPPVR
jgi:hypothetical protein